VFVNGASVGLVFGFKDTTGFVDLPAGSYDFDIVPAGGTIEDSVFNVPGFTVADGEQWSVYAAGYVAPADGNNGFTIGAIPESRGDIPAGQVRVQVVHAAALAAFDPIDVWLVDGDCAPVDPLAAGFAFGDMGVFDLPNTSLNVGLDVGQDATVDACYKIPDVGVSDDIVTVYAINNDAGVPSLVAHLPDGSNAEINAE